MWILSKHLKLSHAHSELEALILQRTAELQKLSQRLLKVQDEERRKIARDLHDSTGQTLAALKIGVSLLQQKCTADPAALAIVSDVAQLADQAMFRFVGIEPTDQRILVLKSSVHFRADFEPIAETIIICAAPGAMPADPAALPWTRLRAGMRIKPNGPAFGRALR